MKADTNTPSRPSSRAIGAKRTKDILVMPGHLNAWGTLFGGNMMAWADEMAYLAASLEFPHCTFVTKLFGQFDFTSGPKEGQIVRIESEILKVGRTSVTVGLVAYNAFTKDEIFRTSAVMVNARKGKSYPISPEEAAA